jgi:hypothetical protein
MSPTRAWADKLIRLELERLQPIPDPVPVGVEEITPEQAAHNVEVLLAGLSDDPAMMAWAYTQSVGQRNA